MLSQYAPLPLRLPYIVYLTLLATAILLFWAAPETVESRKDRISLKPRLGVPRDLVAPFVAPAGAAFSVFALSGLFAALIPTLLDRLHETSSAVAGVVVLGYYAIGALSQVLLRRLTSHTSMLIGLGVLLGAVALVVLAPPEHSLALLLGGTVFGGVSLRLCFRGSLLMVNQIAPSKRRAEMLSTFFIVAYVGIALPAVGIGVLSQFIDRLVSHIVFAVVVAAFAVMAIITGIRNKPAQ